MKSLLLIAVLFFTVNAQSQTTSHGRKAPAFALEDISGNTVELKNLLGKGPVIIDFWATWCKPCIEELTEMQKWIVEYKEKPVTVLAVSTDNEKSVAKVKPFVKAKGFPFTVLLDTNSDVARLFYAQNIPFTALLDKEGRIVYTHTGYRKGDELELRKALDELLAK